MHSREFNSGVVRLENLVVGKALFRETISTDLAHADAVSPTAAEKSESSDVSVVVILVFDDKKLFAQTQRRTNMAAEHLASSIRADDLEVDRSFRTSARHDAQVDQRSNTASEATQTRLRLAEGQFSSPVGKRREAIRGRPVWRRSHFEVINFTSCVHMKNNRFATDQSN